MLDVPRVLRRVAVSAAGLTATAGALALGVGLSTAAPGEDTAPSITPEQFAREMHASSPGTTLDQAASLVPSTKAAGSKILQLAKSDRAFVDGWADAQTSRVIAVPQHIAVIDWPQPPSWTGYISERDDAGGGDAGFVAGVVPETVDSALVHLSDGNSVTVRVANDAFLLDLTPGVRSLSIDLVSEGQVVAHREDYARLTLGERAKEARNG